MQWVCAALTASCQLNGVVGNIRPFHYDYSLPLGFFSGKQRCVSVVLWHVRPMLENVSLVARTRTGATRPGCTVLSVFRSCSSNDSLAEGLNQPAQSTPSLPFLFLTRTSYLTLHVTQTPLCQHPQPSSSICWNSVDWFTLACRTWKSLGVCQRGWREEEV